MKKLLLLFLALLTTIGLKAESTELILESISPANGSNYLFENGEGGGYVTFVFNHEFTIDKASVVNSAGTKFEINDFFYSTGYRKELRCNLSAQIKNLMKAGDIQTGEKFKVIIEGVKTKDTPPLLYGTDGTVAVELVATRLPAYLVSMSKPENATIKGYYEKGDAEGLITYTFSENVTCGSAKIAYGNVEKDTYGEIDLPVQASGADLTVNLQDIRLNPEDIKGNTMISISIYNVKSEDGYLIDGNFPGSPGAINYSYTIKKTIAEDIYGGYLTDDIDKSDNLECYVSAHITYSGIKLSYQLGGAPTSIIIPASQTTNEMKEDGFYIYAPIKDLSFDAGNVTAQIVDAQSDYGDAVVIEDILVSKGKKAASTCLSATPVSGQLGKFPEEFTIVFNNPISIESAMLVTTNLEGLVEEVNIAGRNAFANNNIITISNFRFTIAGKFSFKLQVKDSDGKYLTYGDTENFVTLTYEIPSNTFICSAITPETGAVSSLKEFMLTFNGVDEFDFVGGFDDSKKVLLTNEAGETVATGSLSFGKANTEAKVVLNKEVTADGIYSLTIPEGTVFNNLWDDSFSDFGASMGAIYNPELKFAYAINVPPATFEINPMPGEFDNLPTEITITFSRNVTIERAMLKSGEFGSPYNDIMPYVTAQGNVVSISLPADMIVDYTAMLFSLQVKDVTGYITMGSVEGFINFEYIKKVNAALFTCASINPQEGKVEKLKDFTLTFEKYNMRGDFIGGIEESKEIVLKDAWGQTVARGTATADFQSLSLDLSVALDKEITAAGVYTLLIPEATIYNSDYDSYADDKGVGFGAVYNPELSFRYIVGEIAPTTCTINPAPGEFDALPTDYQFTFSRKVTVETALLRGDLPGASDIASFVTVTDNVVNIQLPARFADSSKMFMFILKVRDEVGLYVTVGDSEDLVNALYTKKIVANTFICENVDPAPGNISSLKEFTLTFKGVNPMGDMIGGIDEEKAIVLKDAANNIVATATASPKGMFSLDVSVTLSTEIKAAGTYTLFVPEATVYNEKYDEEAPDKGVETGAVYNPEIRFTYSLIPTGIHSVLQDMNGEVEVYNVQGIFIRKADVSKVLEGLEKGIYIVNGKKIAVE